jgi:exonuclease SbcC
MKIINLAFSNINSLAGTWSIDFENPAFSEGLFAITGPTGAGKTSVLDAISLALYGKTVREDISKDHNEVMTQGTGQCHAELTFEVDKHRYRCRWSQDRARKKPDGTLQNAAREIADAATGAILADQLRNADAKVVELTGLSFDQFTRAVLLAQGQFDTFLKAKDSERADILEKITNTGIFSKIGTAVFTRFQEEKQKKEALELAQASIAVMTIEDRGLLDAQLEEARRSQAGVLAELEALGKQLSWLGCIDTLKKEESDLAVQKEALDLRRRSNHSDLAKLVVAETARKLDVDLLALDNARTSQSDATTELAAREGHSAACQIKQAEIASRLAETARLAETTKRALEADLPKLAEIRKLDQQINLAEQARSNADIVLTEAKQNHTTAVLAHTEAINSHAEAQTDLKEATEYQQTHALDRSISTLLPPIQAKHSVWVMLQRTAVATQSTAAIKVNEVAAADSNAAKALAKMQSDERAVAKAKSALDAQLPVFEKAKSAKATTETAKNDAEGIWTQQQPLLIEQRELAEAKVRLTQQVAELSELRLKLTDGSPCPLCGAEVHPFALGNVPNLTAAEKELGTIKLKLSKLEKSVQDARTAYDAAARALTGQQELVTKLTSAFNTATSQLDLSTQAEQTALAAAQTSTRLAAEAADLAKTATAETQTAWKEIATQLTALDVPNPLPDGWAGIIAKLETREQHFANASECAKSASIRIQEALKAIAGAHQRVQSTAALQLVKQTELTDKSNALIALTEKRKTQYGDLNPDSEETRLREANETAAANLATMASEKATCDQAALSAIQEVETAKEQFAKAVSNYQSTFEACTVKWQSSGFPDEAECRAARWSDTEIARVTALRKELETLTVEINTKCATNHAVLIEQQAKAVTERSADEVTAEIATKQTARETADERVKDLDFKARTDSENRVRLARHGTELDNQKVIFDRWKRLNDMIGTEGGVRFKKYAQGITLNRLLKAANPHLSGMTQNRYALLWNVKDGEALLPSIIDNHQAEAKRPTSNLSGGETFMVSLALALGLSGMASGKLQVDSLFLDEGFGTLDPEVLDLAIGTLNRLHHSQGKLIGVISHIDQLKNQISTKIEVTKLGNGRSKLSGPGVEQVASKPEKPTKAEKPNKKEKC